MQHIDCPNRPHTTVILAISADGKIADEQRSPARFGSAADKAHLEKQIALADAVLFGAATLRAYGTTLRVSHPDLIEQRQQQGKPAQPIQMVCSQSGHFDPELPFFRQPVPHWLLTTPDGAIAWKDLDKFDRILTSATREIDWKQALEQMKALGIDRLAVIGGGNLVASLLRANLLDECWFTICPLLLGGQNAPTPVEGIGFPAHLAPRLELISVEQISHELFLHYRLQEKRD